MALSGTKTQNIRDGYQLRLEWSATQSISENTSKITCKLYLKNNYELYISKRNPKIILDGETINLESSAISTIGDHLLCTTSRTLQHNNDGTRSFTLSASFDLKATISGNYYGTINIADSTNTLNQIYRATQPSINVNSANMGTSITISTRRASTSFTHKLYYSFGTKNKILISDSVTTSYTFTIPLFLASEIPHKTSGTLTIACETIYNSQSIGTKTDDLTIVVPDNCRPVISGYTLSEKATKPAAFSGYYIQNISDIQVTVNTDSSNAYGSWITSCVTTFNSISYTGNPFRTGIIKKSGSLGLSTTITDSRGRAHTYSSDSITVIPYHTPQIPKFEVMRCNSSGNVDESGGKYLRYTYSYNISPISTTSAGDLNTKNLRLQYYNKSNSSWTNIITKSGTGMTYVATNTTGYSTSVEYDVDDTYNLRLEIKDAYRTVYAYANLEPTYTLINFASNGKALAFNGVCSIGEGVQFHEGIYDKNGLDINAAPQLLWSGNYLMNASQSITLSKTISSQKNGIMLVFSPYTSSGTSVDGNYTVHFVSKLAVSRHLSKSFSFFLCDDTFANIGCKTIHIADNKLTGVAGNQNYGTTNGVSWKNVRWVLREIYGM